MDARGAVFAIGAIAAIAACALTVACRSPAQVRLVDATPGACGQAIAETAVKVTAYTPSGEIAQAIAPGGAVAIDDFPADTEQLGVEVLAGSGATVLAGKTAPLDFAGLVDGSELAVFVAPPDGFCAVGALTEPRAAPLVALAGDGVLVVGGANASGPLSTAERYDYATASFVPVPVPELLDDPVNGLAGGVLTPLPDGRVVLSGTARTAIVIYDPTKHAFGSAGLFDQRAFHAAIALDDDHMLVAGGCSGVLDGACTGLTLLSSEVYDIANPALNVPGPVLRSPEIGAAFYDTGAGYLLAGGSGDVGVANLLVVGQDMASTITSLRGAFAPLDGGAVLSADATAALVIPPGAGLLTPVPAATDGDDTLVALEDGRVLSIGSDEQRYDPTSEVWTTLPPVGDAPGPLGSATALRLPDGSVLVLGGSPASDAAWIFRPSLVGPSSGSVVVAPSGGGLGVMTAPDPARLAVANYTLTASVTDLDARALVGGTRMATGSIAVAATIGNGGGAALIARQVAPGDALVARLVPGAAAELDDLASGATLCTGGMTAAFVPGIPVQLELDLDDSSATVLRDGVTELTCGIAGGARGAWGVAPLGGDGSGQLTVLTATVTR